jgi:hypothetical protein
VAAAVPVAAAAGGVAAVAPGAAASPDATAPGTEAPALAASVLTDPPATETVAETKPGEAKPDAPKDGDPKPGDVKPAVEYTDFTLPDGLTAENPTLAMFREEAATLGLTQEQAQALVTKIGTQAQINAEAQMANWQRMNNEWQAQIKADPETGGDNFEPMRLNVGRLFDDYVGPVNSAERKQLNVELLTTGAGNLPTLTKMLNRIAQAHTEGGHVSGNPARTPASTADLLYPTHNK